MNESRFRGSPHKTLGIVVPVYNTEVEYLAACLESLNQDDDDYIVAIVDDGSCTDTAAWCNSFSEAHPDKYLYVRRENGGQNAARFTGVEVLSCDYVSFVDSDDRLAPGAIRLINETLIAENPDLLIFGFTEGLCSAVGAEDENSPRNKVRSLLKKELLSEKSSLWGAVFRRSMVEKEGLANGFHIGEDFASFFNLASRCENIVGFDVGLYLYSVRPTSITQNNSYPYALEIVKAFDYLLSKGCKDSFMVELEWQAIKHLLFWEPLRLIRTHQATKDSRRFLSEYMIEHFPKWRSNPYYLCKRSSFGADFHLLVAGRWSLYEWLWRTKMKLKELR